MDNNYKVINTIKYNNNEYSLIVNNNDINDIIIRKKVNNKYINLSNSEFNDVIKEFIK